MPTKAAVSIVTPRDWGPTIFSCSSRFFQWTLPRQDRKTTCPPMTNATKARQSHLCTYGNPSLSPKTMRLGIWLGPKPVRKCSLLYVTLTSMGTTHLGGFHWSKTASSLSHRVFSFTTGVSGLSALEDGGSSPGRLSRVLDIDDLAAVSRNGTAGPGRGLGRETGPLAFKRWVRTGKREHLRGKHPNPIISM